MSSCQTSSRFSPYLSTTSLAASTLGLSTYPRQPKQRKLDDGHRAPQPARIIGPRQSSPCSHRHTLPCALHSTQTGYSGISGVLPIGDRDGDGRDDLLLRVRPGPADDLSQDTIVVLYGQTISSLSRSSALNASRTRCKCFQRGNVCIKNPPYSPFTKGGNWLLNIPPHHHDVRFTSN